MFIVASKEEAFDDRDCNIIAEIEDLISVIATRL